MNQDTDADRSAKAKVIAEFISSLIQMPDKGGPMEQGGARYNLETANPPRGVSEAFGFKHTGEYNPLVSNEIIERLGAPLEYPYYGGSKFIVPPSAGIPATQQAGIQNYLKDKGSMFQPPLESGKNSDPLAQEIYGNLVVKGHPVYGPSFESLYGKPGIIGFGRK